MSSWTHETAAKDREDAIARTKAFYDAANGWARRNLRGKTAEESFDFFRVRADRSVNGLVMFTVYVRRKRPGPVGVASSNRRGI
ncbi:MAG: hypothetical protein WCB19_07470 [Thermoplasmata archaeon]